MEKQAFYDEEILPLSASAEPTEVLAGLGGAGADLDLSLDDED